MAACKQSLSQATSRLGFGTCISAAICMAILRVLDSDRLAGRSTRPNRPGHCPAVRIGVEVEEFTPECVLGERRQVSERGGVAGHDGNITVNQTGVPLDEAEGKADT